MNTTLRQKNPNASPPRSWIKYTSRQPCVPMYGDLYHYAGNNPVRYMDPDGNSINKYINERVLKAISYLYKNSETFQSCYKTLASETNAFGKPLYTLVEVINGKYAGNTQTQECTLTHSVKVQTYKNGQYIYNTLDPKQEYQAIIISIDIDRIDSKNLNILEVVAEEFVHSTEASRVGTAAWNDRARRENRLPYKERPEEIRAKEVVKKIMAEVERNEEDR